MRSYIENSAMAAENESLRSRLKTANAIIRIVKEMRKKQKESLSCGDEEVRLDKLLMLW